VEGRLSGQANIRFI